MVIVRRSPFTLSFHLNEIIVVAVLFATPALAQDFALPDPVMTTGAIDPTATLDVICNSTTKRRRHVSAATANAVATAYNVPRDEIGIHYELDHLIPLAIGGSNAAANLWPQPDHEAALKDRLENELQRRACIAYRTLTPEDATRVLAQEQQEVATDWIAAYATYVER